MKSRFLTFLVLIALTASTQFTRAEDAPLRLALLYPPEAAAMGDLLTAELSKQPRVDLVEREQIRKIFQEKSLNAVQAKQDWANIGQFLGAEGLIVLDSPETKSGSAPLRLIWAERGIVVYETGLSSSEKDPQKIVKSTLPKIQAAVRKLGELRHAGKSAVAMHIKSVNADSGKDIDLRQGLGLLFAQRMLDEPGWVVVDRRNLVDAGFENDLAQGKTEQKLVTATHRLTLGFAKEGDLLKIRGQLEMPDGQSRRFEFAGKFDEPAVLASTFMAELRKAMGLEEGKAAQAWDPIQEAKANVEWARRELHVNYFRSPNRDAPREWYEAISSAWALGLRTQEVAILRATTLAYWAWPEDFNLGHSRDQPCKGAYMVADRNAIQRMVKAVDHLRDCYNSFRTNKPFLYFGVYNPKLIQLVLGRASHLLGTVHNNGADLLYSDDLRVLRKAIRDAVDELSRQPGQVEWEKYELTILVLNSGMLWDETNDEAQQRLEGILLPFRRKNYKQFNSTPFFTLVATELSPHSNIAQPLFYPKPAEDESACLRRGLEVIDKLAKCAGKDQQLFAKALRARLNDERPFNEVPEEEDLEVYFGRTPHEVNTWSGNVAPFDHVEEGKIPEFFVRLLSERAPDQFVKSRALHELVSYANNNEYSSADALRIAQALDTYWKDVERISPLLKDRKLIKDKTYFVKGRGDNEYFGFIADTMGRLRLSHGNVDAWLQQQYPERELPAAAFPVKRLWFSRHWKPVAAISMNSYMNARRQPVETDGHNLFLSSDTHGVNSRRTGVWMLTPPETLLKPVFDSRNFNGGFHHQSTFDGWFFFCSTPDANHPRTPNCSLLYAARAGKAPAICNCDFSSDCRVIGWLPPYAYVLAGAEGRLYRWNPEKTSMELIADGSRKPSVNPLDEHLDPNSIRGWNEVVFAKLPNGDDGLAIKNQSLGCSISYPAFAIAQQSGNVTLLGGIDATSSLQQPWANPFLKMIDNGRFVISVENSKETFDLQLNKPFGKTSVLHSESVTGSFESSFPGNIYHLAQKICYEDVNTPYATKRAGFVWPVNCPVNFTMGRSVHPFVMGDFHGAVLMEQLMGREKYSAVWLVFFEADGIKAIPLRFEPKPDELLEIKQYVQSLVNGPEGTIGNSDGWMRNAVAARPQWEIDTAWGLDDALVISVAKIDALWFLTKADVEEARRLAVPIKQ